MSVHHFFGGVIILGVVLDIYFFLWRYDRRIDGRMSVKSLERYALRQRRVATTCYLLGGVGLAALFIGATALKALLLSVLTVMVFMIATQLP